MRSGQTGSPGQPEGSLLELLLTEVVPRLTRLASGPQALPGAVGIASPGRPVAEMRLEDGPTPPGPLLVHALELAERCQHGDAKGAGELVARLRESGVPIEAIMLQLIQPAAQHLGLGWCEDRVSFTDVTIGLGHLQQIFSSLLDDFHTSGLTGALTEDGALPPQAFFCTLPGATHRLGVQMVRAFFARAGWRTRVGQGDESALFSQMAAMKPDMIALSLGSETDLRAAAGFILRARNACRNFSPVVMVGGAAVPFFPSLVERLDADIVSGDATDALARATELLTERTVGTR